MCFVLLIYHIYHETWDDNDKYTYHMITDNVFQYNRINTSELLDIIIEFTRLYTYIVCDKCCHKENSRGEIEQSRGLYTQ